MMVTETIEIDAAWTAKLTKTRVPFSYAPTVGILTNLPSWYLGHAIRYLSQKVIVTKKFHPVKTLAKVANHNTVRGWMNWPHLCSKNILLKIFYGDVVNVSGEKIFFEFVKV